MNRKLLLGALSLCFGALLSANAQTVVTKRDTAVTAKSDKFKVITNYFSQNWFMGAGVGAQFYNGDHDGRAKFGDRITPGFELYVGKWFSPEIGFRAAINGYEVKGLTQNGAHSTGERYSKLPWEGYWLTNAKWQYYNLHGDVMFNLSNLIAGYKPERKFTSTPYLGVGWMLTWEEPKAREVSLNLGFYNALRLNSALDLTLDVRGSMVNDRFDGELGARKEEGLFTATLGIAYKFKKRGWDKQPAVRITDGYDEIQVARVRERINELVRDNDALRRELKIARNEGVTDIKVKQNVLVSPILVTFEINKSVVNNRAKVNLAYFAKTMLAGNPNIIYSITGFADKGTGTPAINERLSRARAEAVFNVLVHDNNVPANRLRVKYEGGVDNMFYDDPKLSRAVITMAD